MKNIQRWISLVLALLMVIGCVPSVADEEIIAQCVVQPAQLYATENVPRSSDLNLFVINVEIKDEDGNDVTNGPLYVGRDYTFGIKFSEKGKELQFDVDSNNQLTYQLPTGITYSGKKAFDALNTDGVKVGEFEIVEGKIKFTPWYYNDTSGTGTYSASPKEKDDPLFTEAFTDSVIWCNLHGKLTQNSDQTKIDFGNGVTKEFEVKPYEEKPYADVTKSNEDSKLYTDEATGRRYFLTTIIATVKDGDPDSLTIIDTVNWNSSEYIEDIDQSSFSIKQIRGETETILSNVSPTWNPNWPKGFSLTLNKNDLTNGLKKDDQFVITYKNYLTEKGKQYMGTNDITTMENGVKSKIDGREREDKLSYIIRGKPTMIKKTSSGKDEENPNRINWEIIISDGQGTNIAGKTITDTWAESIQKGENKKLDRIEMVNESRTIQLTVVKADGTQMTHDVPADEVQGYFQAKTDADNKQTGFQFTVPDVPSGYEKIIGCKVNYKTEGHLKNENGFGEFGITNKAEYDEDHRSGESDGHGGNRGFDDFERSKTFDEEKDGKLYFTVKVKIPKEARGQTICVSDWPYLDSVKYENRLSVPPEIISVMASDGTTKKVFTEGTGDWHYQGYNEGSGFFMFFNMPGIYVKPSDTDKPNSIWKWDTNKDVELTIEYAFDIEKIRKVAKETGREAEAGILYNHVKIILGGLEKTDEAPAPFGKHAKIEKKAELQSDGTIKYTVLINSNFLAQIPEKAIFMDEFDAEHLEYVNNSLKVELLAYGNSYWSGCVGTPNYSETELKSGPAGTLTVKFDEFDQGGWTAGTAGNCGMIGIEQKDYPTLQGWYRRAYINNKTTYYTAVRLTYSLQIKNAKPGQDTVLRNKAKIEGYADASAEVTYHPTLLEKQSGQMNGSKLPYTITVNPTGAKLLSGNGTLLLTDQMSDNMVPLLQTLKVYKEDETELPKANWQYSYNPDKNVLKLSLPDEMALTVRYEVMIQGAPGAYVKVSNTASMEGFEEVKKDEKNLQISQASGGAGGTQYTILLLKQAKDTGMSIAGAKFKIEWILNGEWTEFCTITTLKDDVTQITRSTDGKEGIYADQVYRITEIKAPANYQQLTAPIYLCIPKDKTVEQICQTMKDELNAQEDKKEIQEATILTRINSQVTVIPNEPCPGIEFKKVSASNANKMLGGATFKLTQRDVSETEWKREAESTLEGVVSFPQIQEGVYRLEETKAPVGYTASNGYWIVTVTDTNGVRTVTYEAKDGAPSLSKAENGSMLLPNQREDLPNLPSVGGSGTTAYSLLGLALMAIATAAAYALARRKKVMRPQ